MEPDVVREPPGSPESDETAVDYGPLRPWPGTGLLSLWESVGLYDPEATVTHEAGVFTIHSAR